MAPICSPATTSDAARQQLALYTLFDEAHADPAFQKLWFDFRHITDELVFYGMNAQVLLLRGICRNVWRML